MPLKLQINCTAPETSDKIKEIAINRYSLSLEIQARKLSYLIRLIFFGELSIADFIDRVSQELQIEKELAQKIALDINKEIFHKVALELKEIQGKLSEPSVSPSNIRPSTRPPHPAYGEAGFARPDNKIFPKQIPPGQNALQDKIKIAPYETPQLKPKSVSAVGPPPKLPTLKEEYEEKKDKYLETITQEDRIRRSYEKAGKKSRALIEGNIVNLKGSVHEDDPPAGGEV